MILGVLAKATMFAFVPVLAFGLAVLLWRRQGKLRDWPTMGTTAAVLIGIWAILAPIYHHSFIPVPGGGGSVVGQAGGGGAPGISAKLSYIWQIFLPPLPFMHHDFAPGAQPVLDIYVLRPWGGFGCARREPTARVLVADRDRDVPDRGARPARGLARAPARARAHTGDAAPDRLAPLRAGLHARGFARYNPAASIQEQGRYAFPAFTVLAVIGVTACFGLGRRRAPLGAVTLVAAMMPLSGFAQLYVFSSYFT